MKTKLKILQLHVADHCNLQCEHCSHGSPLAPAAKYSWADYEHHIQQLGKYASTRRWDVMGGEPFLAPENLHSILSGLYTCSMKAPILLVTNGFWIEKWEQYRDFLPLVYQLDITIHPGLTVSVDIVREKAQDIRKILGVRTNVTSIPYFYNLKFVEKPIKRAKCKTCTQLLPDGRISKCHLIAYSKFYPHLTTQGFRDNLQEGFYKIENGDAPSLEKWYRKLHTCCDYCRYIEDPTGQISHKHGV